MPVIMLVNKYDIALDNSPDYDGDGFRNWFECCVGQGPINYYDEYHGGPGTRIEPPPPDGNWFDPEIPDLFVVVTDGVDENGDPAIHPDNVLEFVNQLGINVHQIDEDKVGGVYEEDRLLPESTPEIKYQIQHLDGLALNHFKER